MLCPGKLIESKQNYGFCLQDSDWKNQGTAKGSRYGESLFPPSRILLVLAACAYSMTQEDLFPVRQVDLPIVRKNAI